MWTLINIFMEEKTLSKKEEDCNWANTEGGKVTDEKRKRDIFLMSALAVLVLGSFVLGFSEWSKYQQSKEVANTVGTTPQNVESLPMGTNYLKANNELYKAGVDASLAGDKVKALELLEKSKIAETSTSAKGVIDFTIATVNFDLDRNKGIDGLVDLSENAQYSNRVRALAMMRSYLLYRAYNDISLLRNIASSSDIVWTNSDAVTLAYMKKITDLHPFAYPLLKIMSYELDAMENKGDKLEAERLYNKYKLTISKNIEEMKKSEGERTELTSTWLANANMLGRLHMDYGIGQRAEVENEHRSLIEYDRLYMFKVNENYTLLSYANFLSGMKDYTSAEKAILEIVANGVAPAVSEALPKIIPEIRYPHLITLSKNVKDPRVQSFLSIIGSKPDVIRVTK